MNKTQADRPFILLRNGTVFAPEPKGQMDLILCGDRIALMDHDLNVPSIYLQDSIDLKGKWVFPGLLDPHVHIAGAGGEGGPGTRTEGIKIDRFLQAGITTVVGCLGTDGITRSVDTVLLKAKTLRAQGLSAWIYTGSYQIPPPTITGSISRDIALFQEIIGVGEVALSDHRSSMPSLHEFVRVLQQARLGGMIAGKCGLVNIHIGDYGEPFAMIDEALSIPGIHAEQMLPTHCNRSRLVFEKAKAFAKRGFIDLTCSSYPYFPDVEIKPSTAWEALLEDGAPPESITLSSDAGGSLPRFNSEGQYSGMAEGDPGSILKELIDMIEPRIDNPRSLEMALATATRNTAKRLKLKHKGTLTAGASADLMVLDSGMNIDTLFANGRLMMRAGRLTREPNDSIAE